MKFYTWKILICSKKTAKEISEELKKVDGLMVARLDKIEESRGEE